jgi:hypothetical protein
MVATVATVAAAAIGHYNQYSKLKFRQAAFYLLFIA